MVLIFRENLVFHPVLILKPLGHLNLLFLFSLRVRVKCAIKNWEESATFDPGVSALFSQKKFQCVHVMVVPILLGGG